MIGQIENKHVRANRKLHAEYERMRQQDNNTYSNNSTTMNADLQNIQACLLNIRSLSKHNIDIKHDAQLTKCDILALTETQLLPHHSDNTIRETLHPYKLHRQDHPSDKYSSLAICTKENIQVLEKQYIPAINGLMFVILNSLTNKQTSYLLTYRKNNSNIQQYVEGLRYILETSSVDIVLGNFNVNYFDQNNNIPLNRLMTSNDYVQIVQSPTFVSAGSLLDHVYVKQKSHNTIQNSLVNVYYSDRDAVKITIYYA